MLPLRVPTRAWSSSLRSSSASKALATPHCSQAGGGRLAATACGESEERTLMDSGLSSCASLACMALFVAAFGVDAVSRACNILATWLEARAERHSFHTRAQAHSTSPSAPRLMLAIHSCCGVMRGSLRRRMGGPVLSWVHLSLASHPSAQGATHDQIGRAHV